MSEPRSSSPIFPIELGTQTVFPLAELPSHAPKLRGGKRLHIATAFRWAKHGARAKGGALVRLPIIQVAGTKCTSSEAFQWFCDMLTTGANTANPSPRGVAARRRELAKVDRELDRRGV